MIVDSDDDKAVEEFYSQIDSLDWEEGDTSIQLRKIDDDEQKNIKKQHM